MKDPSLWVKDSKHWSWKKHKKERRKNGFSYADWINFNDYISWVNIQALEKFKTGAGHPVYGEVETMEDWVRVLDEMINGFEAVIALSNMDFVVLNDREQTKKNRDALVAVQAKGFEQYAKYFGSLWD